jgi:phosphoenolpyruvate-protein kinase (PTS system EI component)
MPVLFDRGGRLVPENSGYEKTGVVDKLERKMGVMALEDTIERLRDELTVTAAMTERNAARIKEHQEWLEANERAAAMHREWLQQHEAAMQAHETAMRNVEAKLDRIADLLLKGRGGNGAQ